jgi:hypothetical protein
MLINHVGCSSSLFFCQYMNETYKGLADRDSENPANPSKSFIDETKSAPGDVFSR